MIDLVLNLLLTAVIGNIDVAKAATDFQDSIVVAEEPVLRPVRVETGSESKSIGVKTSAESVLALDAGTGEILYAKNIKKQRPIASITKLMTALVFLEHNPGWDEKVVFSEEDKKEGSKDYIYNGEQVSVRDLFHLGLMLSNNSSMASLVRSTGFSEDEFVAIMNKKAEEFGMADTEFTGIIGLDTGNVSTAADVAKLAAAAFANEDIKTATQKGRYTVSISNSGRQFYIYNTNYLLSSYLNEGDFKIVGGKTGHLNEAGYCLTTQIKNNNGGEIISVVLGSGSMAGRFSDTKALSSWVFDNYIWE